MSYDELIFPFGEILLPQEPNIQSLRNVFILGAYPSAFHIRWIPPSPYREIKAIAVDNEPSVFWDGSDQETIFKDWLNCVSWQDDWGKALLAGNLNGSSGVWVNKNLLVPLGLSRKNVWFSDCLDIYHCSDGLKKRLQDTYHLVAEIFNLANAKLPPHPDENQIVQLSLKNHASRIKNQLNIAKPDLIITLGNAALRVISSLITSGPEIPKSLSPNQELYGKKYYGIQIENTNFSLLPIAHPAAPPAYQDAHKSWMENIYTN